MKISIKSRAPVTAELLIDGVDLSKHVNEIKVCVKAGEAPTVAIILSPDEIEIEGNNFYTYVPELKDKVDNLLGQSISELHNDIITPPNMDPLSTGCRCGDGCRPYPAKGVSMEGQSNSVPELMINVGNNMLNPDIKTICKKLADDLEKSMKFEGPDNGK